jgi:hypothetical protein
MARIYASNTPTLKPILAKDTAKFAVTVDFSHLFPAP